MIRLNMSKNTKGIILVTLSSLLFGSYGAWAKLIGSDFQEFFQGYTRALIVLLILLPIGIYYKRFERIKKKDIKWFTTFITFGAFTQAPLFYAFNNMHIGTAILLFYSAMLITMYTIGFIFMREKPTLVKIVALILGLAGLGLTFKISLVVFTFFAPILALLNGIASGGEVAFTKKVSDKYSTIQINVLVWVGILFSNLLFSLVLKETQVAPAVSLAWIYQLGYSLSSLLAFLLVIEGFKYVEASIGGLLGLLEIIFGVLLGILLFNEVLEPEAIIGGLLILIAAGLPHLQKLHHRPKYN